MKTKVLGLGTLGVWLMGSVLSVPPVAAERAGTAAGQSTARRHEQAAKPAGAARKAATPRLFVVPKTPWGHPNLQGVWNYATVTPLERPSKFGARAVLEEEELQQEDQAAETRASAEKRPADRIADLELAYNQEWWDRGKSIGRTSLIIDPPDGRIPALSPQGQQTKAARDAARRGRGAYDSYTDVSLNLRCIVRVTAGPPLQSAGYNNNIHLFQTPDYVVILNEQIHDARIVPLDRRPHLPSRVRQWMGDSQGHFEGNTLVVDTTNFSEKYEFRGSDENLHLIERFTPVDANTMKYEYTVDDPSMWSRTWKAELPMRRTSEPMYEYACHEGNYALANVLRGARAQEKAGASTAAPSQR